MRKGKVFVMAAIMTLSFAFTAFAGEWKQEADGRYWYQNEDGSYPISEWKQIDGKWYYFHSDGMMAYNTWIDDCYLGNDGAMYVNTTTPDGYTVDINGKKIELPTIVNVEGLSSQQDGYIVTYQYFNVFEEYGTTKYQAIIEIQNTGNGNLYLGTSTFDIYDRSGNIVSSETFISSDPDVIAPGQKGYFYSNGGYLDDVPMGDYILKPRINVEKTNLPATRFVVGQSSMKMSKFGQNPAIVGTVTNNTTEDEGLLWIVVVFYDKNNLPIGICGTNILDFNAGVTTGFELEGWHLPEYVTKDKISRYEIIAAPNQYQF